MQLELVKLSAGQGYEKDTPARLWHPAIRDYDEKAS